MHKSQTNLIKHPYMEASNGKVKYKYGYRKSGGYKGAMSLADWEETCDTHCIATYKQSNNFQFLQ